MEVFWFMKKIFLKKAVCFLLILLIAMSNTIVGCFAGKYRKKDINSRRQEYVREYVSSGEACSVLCFMSKEDKRYMINLYNEWCCNFGGTKKSMRDNFFISDFRSLYDYFIDLDYDLPVPESKEIYDFFCYCADINDIII